MNVVGLPGRLICGLTADRLLGPINTLTPVALICGVLLYCWATVDSLGSLFTFCVLWLLCRGNPKPVSCGMREPDLRSDQDGSVDRHVLFRHIYRAFDWPTSGGCFDSKERWWFFVRTSFWWICIHRGLAHLGGCENCEEWSEAASSHVAGVDRCI